MASFFGNFFRTLKRIKEKKINFVIFFVTSQCNSKCRSCFFWQSLNQCNDLNLEQIRQISEKMPVFRTLLISGGEPFMRPELPVIINLFYKHNQVRNVGIPTNSLLGEVIVEKVKIILDQNSELLLDINLSLDGLEADHDYVRGVPGSFKKVMELIVKLQELKKRGYKFNLVLNTVICKRNYNNLLDLATKMKQNFNNLDMHMFEIIRGDARETAQKELTVPEVKNIFNKLFKFQVENYLSQEAILSKRVLAIGTLSAKYNLQYRAFGNKLWGGITCPAGATTAVIYPGGDLAYCELKSPVTNLSRENFDIPEVLWRLSQVIRNRIKKEKCDCTHVCFVNEAIWHSFYGIFILIPISFIKWVLFKRAIL